MPRPKVDWNSISDVLLDLDGTLLDLGFDNWFWRELVPLRWGVLHGLSLDEAQARLHPLFRAREGSLEWYSVDYWTRELGFDVAALKREFGHRVRVNPHAVAFLDAVRALGKRVVLVTNAHDKTLEIKLAHTGLGGRFDALYTSHRFNAAKEHPDFWHALAAAEPFDPAATLFIDDSLPVLEAARAHGIGHIIAVNRPDLVRPARHVAGFPSITDFREITP